MIELLFIWQMSAYVHLESTRVLEYSVANRAQMLFRWSFMFELYVNGQARLRAERSFAYIAGKTVLYNFVLPLVHH